MNLPNDPEREATGDASMDRRRERRLAFTHRCLLSIKAPIWAMTNDPVSGRTEDITLHGLRISIGEIDRKRASSWAEAVKEDSELTVEVSLTDHPEVPTLKGQIVWVHGAQDENATAGDDSPTDINCSIGVLFSVLRERESLAIRQLIRNIG